jgi:hypothetical protein
MRKVGVWALAALLCAGLTVSVAVAGDADKDTVANNTRWWSGGWFAGKPKVEEKKPVAKALPVEEAPAERTADVRVREQKAYLRRLQVCDQLLEIAINTHDATLEEQVQQLNQQAYEVYNKRLGGQVGGARFEPADAFTESPRTKAKPEKGKPGIRMEDKP